MSEHVVIGLDSSTQSTKAIAWDRQGSAHAEGRAPIPMANPGLDRYEQNPTDWWHAATKALKECVQALATDTVIDGIAISNQRETIAFVDQQGEPVSPAIVWLDERSRDEVDPFNQQFDAQYGANKMHQITGRHPDLTPCVYTLAWMQKHASEIYRKTACFVDVQCYLVHKLCAESDSTDSNASATAKQWKTGWISADPMGMFDMENKCWSEPILKQLGITTSQLPVAFPPGETLGVISAAAAKSTGLKQGLPVFAAGGDGQCAGLGTDCTTPDRAYINLGTAVVSGIWSSQYRYNPAWRTELAAQGNGYIYENCLRSGAFLLNWFVEQFGLDKDDGNVFDRLEAEALQLPIGSDGLMVQPYWSGVMDPYWDSSARGVITGLSGSHTAAHVYRAILEGITLDQVMATFDMEVAAEQRISHYVAIGGGANSPLWRQMLADASGKPVLISPTVEASALGAGMIAAFGAGWFDSIESAAKNMSHIAQTINPNPDTVDQYAQLLSIYRDMYQATSSINQRLAQVATANRKPKQA